MFKDSKIGSGMAWCSIQGSFQTMSGNDVPVKNKLDIPMIWHNCK